MNTLSRLNLLFVSCHMPAVHAKAIQLSTKVIDGNRRYESTTPVHDMLDKIDRHVGILTRFKPDRTLAPVGDRLRRLERHIKVSEQPPYFFLGADAEHLALTG